MSGTQNIHPSAKIGKGAIIEGDITIGENTFIGAGSIIVCNGGRITIGNNTVIMENAIIRSAASFDCIIGNNVLIGPKACITGAVIHDACFIATNGTIFHGAELASGTVLAVSGIIHINTFCPANTFIPIQHIAYGEPLIIYSPAEAPAFHSELRKTGFVKYVYGIETTGMTNTEVYTAMTNKFLETLSKDE